MRDKSFRLVVLGTYSLCLITIGLPLLGIITSRYIREIQWIEGQRIWQALKVSLSSSLVAMGIISIIGLGGAYFMAFYQFKGKRYFDSLLGLPLVLPPAVTGILLLITFGANGWIGSYLAKIGIHLTFSMKAVILVQVFVGLPLFVQTLAKHFETVDPNVIESAKLEGCNQWQSFWYMTLPLTKYGVVSGFLMCFSRILAEFGGTMLFAGNIEGKTQTLPLAIYSAMESDMGEALLIAMVLLGIAIVLIVSVNGLIGKERE